MCYVGIRKKMDKNMFSLSCLSCLKCEISLLNGSEDMQGRDLGILDIRTGDKVEHCETCVCTYVPNKQAQTKK